MTLVNARAAFEKAVTDAVVAADNTVSVINDNVPFTTPGKTKKYITINLNFTQSTIQNQGPSIGDVQEEINNWLATDGAMLNPNEQKKHIKGMIFTSLRDTGHGGTLDDVGLNWDLVTDPLSNKVVIQWGVAGEEESEYPHLKIFGNKLSNEERELIEIARRVAE